MHILCAKVMYTTGKEPRSEWGSGGDVDRDAGKQVLGQYCQEHASSSRRLQKGAVNEFSGKATSGHNDV